MLMLFCNDAFAQIPDFHFRNEHPVYNGGSPVEITIDPIFIITLGETVSNLPAQTVPLAAGTATSCDCPAGYVVSGIKHDGGWWLDRIAIRCERFDTIGHLRDAVYIDQRGKVQTSTPYAWDDSVLPKHEVMVGASARYCASGFFLSYLHMFGRSFLDIGRKSSNKDFTSSVANAAVCQDVKLPTVWAPNGHVITGLTIIATKQWIWHYRKLNVQEFNYLWSDGVNSAARAVNPRETTTYSVTVSDKKGHSKTKHVTVVVPETTKNK